ncbi:MAG: patatin-like phospholipase family protein [Flavobacteriales bacterium]|nr:patatin-like phospholipase family protein [Flavobacteriales bacterium]
MLIILIGFSFNSYSQKVGLVLSGGGATAVSHIGVLKALEENNIPIDYIAGTSMGALVGGMYAAGYSPDEIEQVFLSQQFKDWAEGSVDEKYVYYLREKDENPSMITFKIELDKFLETSIPTNLISPTALDYGLMKYFAPSTAAADGNFDNLFIPFRCVASDIVSKKPYVFEEGKLATAIRASMSYPFYLTPISHKDKLLFDGGLYNNFPADVMVEDFNPNYIIGSNVSSNFEIPDEDNIISQIKRMAADNTEYSIPENVPSILIEPESSEFSLFDFDKNEELIQIGYDATIKQISKIRNDIKRRVDQKELNEKRKTYRKTFPALIFDGVQVEGMKPSQNTYVMKSLRYKNDSVSVEDLESEYIKVSSDDKIKKIYPEAEFNKETKKFTLKLKTKKGKDLFVSFGGVFSSRPINEAYIGLQYNILSKTAISVVGESYFGKLHNSISGGFRFDFTIPFYWKTTFTIDGWDYFKSSTTFFEDTRPSFLVVNDQYFKTEVAFPVAYKGKIVLDGTAGEMVNKYYQTKQFLSTDTTDKTRFRNFSAGLNFEQNSLNLKQYAFKGSYFSLGGRFIRGEEHTIPGSTSVIKDEFDTILDWFQIKVTYDKYFMLSNKVSLGVFGEGVYSNQPFFNNYTASVLSASAFEPLAESKTLFQENFRAHSYFAFGVKNIYQLFNNFQLRLEGYVYKPHQKIIQDIQKKAFYGNVWEETQFIFGSALVYNTPLGPIAFNANYYDRFEDKWSFMFHFGYIIFNKKSLE